MNKNEKAVIAFICFIIAAITFAIGVTAGRSYTINYQDIKKAESGYKVELNYKDYYYNEDGIYEK